MKRSEMIEVFKDIIDDESCSGDIDLDVVDAILERIEALGMRPERYEGLISNGKRYNKETDQGRDTQIFNTWEPEDETF